MYSSSIMKNILRCILLLMLVGCKTQTATLTNIEWKLIKMNGDDLSAMNPPVTLSLDENQKKVNGYAGCNRFFGAYGSGDSSIKFTGLGSTKMFCQDKMKVEDAYFKALSEIQSFKTEGGKLYLISGSNVILEFTK